MITDIFFYLEKLLYKYAIYAHLFLGLCPQILGIFFSSSNMYYVSVIDWEIYGLYRFANDLTQLTLFGNLSYNLLL